MSGPDRFPYSRDAVIVYNKKKTLLRGRAYAAVYILLFVYIQSVSVVCLPRYCFKLYMNYRNQIIEIIDHRRVYTYMYVADLAI